ncbi:MAG: chromate transporter [Bacteroidales bacterium]|nr:chromate transporter [Bacteroidales bacterium]
MLHLQLFIIFFKVGLFGFGGGYAILPMIYQDVQAFGIISAEDFSNLVGLSQVTPGPIAINAATYVGVKSDGLIGSLVATIAVSLPSFILLLIALMFIKKFKENIVVQSILRGIKPATVGLMASAFAFMGGTALFKEYDNIDFLSPSMIINSADWLAVFIFILTFILIKTTKLGAIKLTLLGGILSVMVGIVLNMSF